MNMRPHKWLWLLPIVSYSLDANAWGLVTHVYFAQSLLWAMPLLDPRLQAAIKRFPELVMAGACLPDLAIVSPVFRHTHHWENAHELLLSARSDEETALEFAAGHLYIDVIAHNHFVPAFEAKWLENSMLTHIASEWAMDAHLAPLVKTTPCQLLNSHSKILCQFIAPRFRCSESRANTALQRLSFWDNVLRLVRLPDLIYRAVRLLDKRIVKYFTYYLAKTQTEMKHIDSVLQGARPQWEPELNHLSTEQMSEWRRECLSDLRLLRPAPIQYFASAFEPLTISTA